MSLDPRRVVHTAWCRPSPRTRDSGINHLTVLGAGLPRADLADLDQLQSERAHALEHPVQRGLVELRGSEHGLGRLEVGGEAVERRKQRIAYPALEPNLVVVDCHHRLMTIERPWVTEPHPTRMSTDRASVLTRTRDRSYRRTGDERPKASARQPLPSRLRPTRGRQQGRQQ